MRRARNRIAMFLAAALTAACAEPGATPVAPLPPTAATPGVPSSTLFATPDLTGVLQFVTVPNLLSPRHAEKVIRAADGGFVELNGFRVDIPAGALAADTRITLDLPSDGILAQRLLASFGPEGTQFSTPVTLTFPLTGVSLNGGPIEVARWENGAWTSLGGTVSLDGTRLQGQTPHFSEYGGKYVLAGG
jgi:hypothetical protein